MMTVYIDPVPALWETSWRLANNEDKEKFEKSNKPTRKENGQGMERVEKSAEL